MTDFTWVEYDEPHATQRSETLRKHPEIKKLMGPEYKSKYIAFFLVLGQLVLSITTRNLNGFMYWVILYVVGATFTQALFLAIHELSHNLFFRKISSNHLFAIFCNFPIIFPFSESFRYYHIHHHRSQGTDMIDTDIPSTLETWLFRGTFGKFLWYNFQIVFYALRPCLTLKQPITTYLILNAVSQLLFNILLYTFFGLEPFRFLLLSILIAGGFGLHPTSAHFVSEHVIFKSTSNKENNQETFDYYGPLNYVTWNVGWHIFHHTFPNVPWSQLPKIMTIAPELVQDTIVHESWVLLPCEFILDREISLYSRIKRRKIT